MIRSRREGAPLARLPRSDQDNGHGVTTGPIAIGIAIAIVICALALAYATSKCSQFTGGIGLSELFSIKCDKQTDTKAPSPDLVKPLPPPRPAGGITDEQKMAPTLARPLGYVAYRVEGGAARASGSLMPADNMPAPPFGDVKPGLVLQATAQKQLRPRPMSVIIGSIEPERTCFKVIDGFRYADEPADGYKSGGWLPVEITKCPSATSVAATPVKKQDQAQVADDLPAAPAVTPPKPARAKGLPSFAERSRWDVGLTTCAVDETQANALQSYLKENLGFSGARDLIQLASRENWIPTTNKVFYYTDDAKPAAQALANALHAKWGFDFAVGKGAGQGVQNGLKGQTLFVHVMSSAC